MYKPYSNLFTKCLFNFLHKFVQVIELNISFSNLWLQCIDTINKVLKNTTIFSRKYLIDVTYHDDIETTKKLVLDMYYLF